MPENNETYKSTDSPRKSLLLLLQPEPDELVLG